MKTNKLIKYLILSFLICISANADEILIKSSNINILEGGNILNAKNAISEVPDDKIYIKSDEVKYNKKNKFLELTKNVNFLDKKEDILIRSDKINYNKISNIITSYGQTFVTVNKIYKINSKNLVYNKNLSEISSNENTKILDNIGNTYYLEKKFILNTELEVIKSDRAKLIDKNNNHYLFENLFINLKSNEIVGKDLKIDFEDNFFGNKKNDPILKGKSTVIDENNTLINKAVFSTCNIDKKKCRGWELNSDVFNHNKKDKLFEYKNSWLKIFNKRIFYIPYFNHPDPSIKRKSGFLTPSYSNSDILGNSVNIPYFKVLSNDKDITFNPRVYADNNFIFQNEFRQIYKNSKLILDSSVKLGKNGTSSHIFLKQNGKINEKANYNVNIQNVTNDNYLKIHSLAQSSPLISDTSLLKSNIDLSFILNNDANLETSFMVYEDLTKTSNDRYQYIFPDFNYLKQVDIPLNYNGTFDFNSYGFYKNYNTNIKETFINNDFLFKSFDKVNGNGLLTNYEIILKNTNIYSENSLNYKEDLDYNVYSNFKFDTSLPLKKKTNYFTNYLNPIFSFKYSPNGNYDMSNKDIYINFDNVFSLNRIGTNEQLEGGRSLSLGFEFSKFNLNDNKILELRMANVLKDKKNNKLPKKTKLNETRSDIFGDLVLNLNKNFKLGYAFSYDRDLDFSNLDKINAGINFNNFITDFYYLTENHDFGNSEVVTNTTSYAFDQENKLSFETSKDLISDFTQYYDFIYEYKTDCLSIGLNYNKKFYRDGSLEPSKSLSFLVKIIPFTEIRGTANTAFTD